MCEVQTEKHGNDDRKTPPPLTDVHAENASACEYSQQIRSLQQPHKLGCCSPRRTVPVGESLKRSSKEAQALPGPRCVTKAVSLFGNIVWAQNGMERR